MDATFLSLYKIQALWCYINPNINELSKCPDEDLLVHTTLKVIHQRAVILGVG